MTTVSEAIEQPILPEDNPPHGPDTDEGWQASLKLAYAFTGDTTLLVKQQRQGPLFVQKPFYPEGRRTCHTYVIHPPGGIVAGDKLGLEVTLGAGSQALLTTPGAGKFYRSTGPAAVQIHRLNVARDAILEWLPQETIIYNGARARMRTIVRLDDGARFIGWEIFCLGLPASAQPFKSGCIDQVLDIRQDGRHLLIEPFRTGPDGLLLREPWAMGGQPVTGTMVATAGEDPRVIAAVREKVCAGPQDGLFAVTALRGLTVCRFLGHDVYKGLKFFRQAWEILRPAVNGSKACAPRIWAT